MKRLNYLLAASPILILWIIVSCKKDGELPIKGCTYPQADNYNPKATIDDGSCIFTGLNDSIPVGNDTIWGCTNPEADNYDSTATHDDGSCIISGCTDPKADNYNPDATEDDGSCIDAREKFAGTWAVGGNCEFPFSLAETTDITFNEAEEDSVTLEPFTAFGGSARGVVDHSDITIPEQTLGFAVFSGSGSIDTTKGIITITYDYDVGFLGAGTCTAEYSMK